MTDDQLHDLVAPYALDALDPGERERFEAHLESCSSCQAALAELRLGAVALGESAARPAPPGLRDRVLTEISSVEQAPRSTTDEIPSTVADLDRARSERAAPLRPRSQVDLRNVALVAAAAFVLLFAGVGTVITELNQQIDDLRASTDEVQRILAADDLVAVELEGAPGIDARLILSPSAGEAILVAQGLPILDEDQTFELWYIDEERAHSAGIFRPDDEETVLTFAAEPPPGTIAFGVTIEPEGGSPQPTSDPILVGEL